MFKITVIAANPFTDLNIRPEEEYEVIRDTLNASKYKKEFKVEYRSVVKFDDLASILSQTKPDILHFSVPGLPNKGLYLNDYRSIGRPINTTDAYADRIQPKATVKSLGELFSAWGKSLKCVVFTTPFSPQSAPYLPVGNVIGMDDLVTVERILPFVEEFYGGLGTGQGLQEAFELGRYKAASALELGDYNGMPYLVNNDPNLADAFTIGKTGSKKQDKKSSPAEYKTAILFMSADPSDSSRLRLGHELREIQEKLQLSAKRDQFVLHQRTSRRPVDISQAILDLAPRIIHFSGHGSSNGELYFEDELGYAKPVSGEALTALFGLVANQVDCVLLNACYSEAQARSIATQIQYVIGMSKEIGDKAAISFSVGFYQALGAGRSIEEAHQFGCVQIMLQGIPEHLTPVLIKKPA